MQRSLTPMIDEDARAASQRVAGCGKTSRFVGDLVRPHALGRNLASQYREMAADEAREAEALEWAEATRGDVSDD